MPADPVVEWPQPPLGRRAHINGGEVTAECALGDYVASAMSSATFVDLGDGTVAGAILPCRGVLAFGATLMECQRLLRSTLEDYSEHNQIEICLRHYSRVIEAAVPP